MVLLPILALWLAHHECLKAFKYLNDFGTRVAQVTPMVTHDGVFGSQKNGSRFGRQIWNRVDFYSRLWSSTDCNNIYPLEPLFPSPGLWWHRPWDINIIFSAWVCIRADQFKSAEPLHISSKFIWYHTGDLITWKQSKWKKKPSNSYSTHFAIPQYFQF